MKTKPASPSAPVPEWKRRQYERNRTEASAPKLDRWRNEARPRAAERRAEAKRAERLARYNDGHKDGASGWAGAVKSGWSKTDSRGSGASKARLHDQKPALPDRSSGSGPAMFDVTGMDAEALEFFAKNLRRMSRSMPGAYIFGDTRGCPEDTEGARRWAVRAGWSAAEAALIFPDTQNI